mgnify:FL=1
MSYKLLTNGLNKLDLSKKKVIVVGCGYMGHEYAKALSFLGINNVTLISSTIKSAKECAQPYGYNYCDGGYENIKDGLASFDLAIIATPTHKQKSATNHLIKFGSSLECF